MGEEGKGGGRGANDRQAVVGLRARLAVYLTCSSDSHVMYMTTRGHSYHASIARRRSHCSQIQEDAICEIAVRTVSALMSDFAAVGWDDTSRNTPLPIGNCSSVEIDGLV